MRTAACHGRWQDAIWRQGPGGNVQQRISSMAQAWRRKQAGLMSHEFSRVVSPVPCYVGPDINVRFVLAHHGEDLGKVLAAFWRSGKEGEFLPALIVAHGAAPR